MEKIYTQIDVKEERRMTTGKDIEIEPERLRRIKIQYASPSALNRGGVSQDGTSETSSGGFSSASEPVTTVNPQIQAQCLDCSVGSQFFTSNAAARIRRAELEAELQLIALKKKEIEYEEELVRKRLAVEIAAIEANQKSIRNLDANGHDGKVVKLSDVQWDEGIVSRPKTQVEALASAIQKLVQQRARCPDSQAFSGDTVEWPACGATIGDVKNMNQLTPGNNFKVKSDLEIYNRALADLQKLARPGPSALQLNQFAVKLQIITCVLNTVRNKNYLHIPQLTGEVLKKLSPHIQTRWCDYAYEHQETLEPEIILLSRFLSREADLAMQFNYRPIGAPSGVAKGAVKKNRSAVNAGYKKRTDSVYYVAEDEELERNKCLICERSHQLPECPDYSALTVDQRWELIKDSKLCFKCIVKRHRRNACKAKPCGKDECQYRHHFTLHK